LPPGSQVFGFLYSVNCSIQCWGTSENHL